MVFLQRRCEKRGIGSPTSRGTRRQRRPGRPRLPLHRRRAGSRPAARRRGHGRSKRRRRRCRLGRRRLLAVCGGYQLLGHSYQLDRSGCRGWASPIWRRESPVKRLIGNVAIEIELGSWAQLLAGFENTAAAPTSATAPSRSAGSEGVRQQRRRRLEGVRRENMVGTYLHGPLLPRNAWLADRLVARALERRYGEIEPLAPLDDDFEAAAAHRERPPRRARRMSRYVVAPAAIVQSKRE